MEANMNLWRFVPAVKKPWNPAYRDVWESMTRRERQVSFLIDCAIIVTALAAFLIGRNWIIQP
jgi:hypothetical protein